MKHLIKIIDSGSDRYAVVPSQIVLGRQYDDQADTIVVEVPEIEKGNMCVMYITDTNGTPIDNIVLNDWRYTIRNNVSQNKFVKIGFRFINQSGYNKGSEMIVGQFLPAPKPDNFVPTEPEQKANLEYLAKYGFTDMRLVGNEIQAFNMSGEKVVSFDLSPFTQAQSDLGETNEESETFVRGKLLSNFENDMGFITKSTSALENYYKKGETYTQEEVKGEIEQKIESLTATQVRNKEPNLVIETTDSNIQTTATNYIITNYSRQPQEYDGLYLTLTDHNNQVVEFAYHNGSWINVGFDKVDLSNYMDLSSEQNVGGRKIFDGEVQFNNPTKHNNDIRLNNSVVKVIDNTINENGNQKDLATQYSADEIVVEENAKTINLQFPKNSGTFALLSDTINKILKHSTFKNENGDDAWATDNIDTTLSVRHENGETQAGVSVSKNYADISALSTGESAGSSKASVTSDGILLNSQSTAEGVQNYVRVTANDTTFKNTPKVVTSADDEEPKTSDVVIKDDLENYVPKQSESAGVYAQVLNENGEFAVDISRNGDLASFKVTKNDVTYNNISLIKANEILSDQPYNLSSEEKTQICENIGSVKAQTCNQGEIKVYCINGDNPNDVCRVSNNGTAGAIVRYGNEGRVICKTDPTNDDHLVRYGFIKNKINHEQIYFGSTLPTSGIGTTYLENDVFILSNSNGTKNFYQLKTATGSSTLTWVDMVDFEKPSWKTYAPADTSQVLETEITITAFTQYSSLVGGKVLVKGYANNGADNWNITYFADATPVTFLGKITKSIIQGLFLTQAEGITTTALSIPSGEITFSCKYLW